MFQFFPKFSVVGEESESMESSSDTESRIDSSGNFLSRWFSDRCLLKTKTLLIRFIMMGRSEATLFSLSRTFSGLYCLMVISIYISVTINKLTSSPMHAPEVEVSALLLYLYLLSCLFLVYLLVCLVRHPHTHDHVKSHGSGFLRQGAVVFGIGSFIYHLLEFITYFIIDLHPNCLDIVHTVISFLAIIFICLQTVTIIMYPRLNIQLANGIPHLGLMHVVATNLIIWMRTVIRESFHAFHEATELKLHSPLINFTKYDDNSSVEDIQELGIRERRSADAGGHSEHGFDLIEHFDMEHCANKYHDDDFVEDILQQSSPFLFCFIIEFSLVGCTVFYNTWHNVHTRREAEAEAAERRAASRPVVRKPNLCATLAKTNWSHSTMGTVSGCFVLLLTLLDLIVFFSSTGGGPSQEAVFEYLGKVLNTFINFLGICSAVAGFIQIQNLADKEESATKDNGVDLFLIDFGVFFIYIYSSLTITVGLFNIDPAIPGSVHILNGVVEIIAVTFQTLLIHQLLIKVERENYMKIV